MASVPKTLAELSRVVGAAGKTTADMVEYFNEITPPQIEAMIKKINALYKTEKDRLKVYEKINDISIHFLDTENEVRKQISYQVNDLQTVLRQQTEIKEQAQKYDDVLQNVSDKTLGKILEQNQQIFQTAKDMQTTGNLTWKQYSEAYNEAFEAARRVNKEVGQSISNAREMIETQNALLLRGGFRGTNIADVANLSSSVLLITRALGDFPNELFLSLQQGYRMFGQQTDKFVTQLGNQINAFSDTFGVQIEMLSQTVNFMVQENAFLYRNNMEAQTRANQNLIRAAALSGQMGLASSAIVSDLASTAQFGTMSEMAELYQGGALLEGFDTRQFQQMMQGGDAASATEMLFRSIGTTINRMDDQYLRAEYMQRIGGSFGLSRDDILMIAANADNLGQYVEDLQDKMIDMDTSMVDLLGDLKMSVVDRLDNWWANTKTSENIGKVLQDAGLVGVSGSLKLINAQLALLTGQSLSGGRMAGAAVGLAKGAFGGGSTAMSAQQFLGAQYGGIFAASGARAPMSAVKRLGMGAGGLALGVGSNIAGRAIQTNTNLSDTGANFGGGALNVLGGALGGAMIGSAVPVIGTAIGAGLGAIAGGINTYLGSQERQSAMQELDNQRAAARQRTQASQADLTGDPVVDAINNMNANLTNVLNENFSESIKMSFVLDTANKTDAGR